MVSCIPETKRTKNKKGKSSKKVLDKKGVVC